MAIEKCKPPLDHEFSCKQFKGQSGEIVSWSNITVDQLKLVVDYPNKQNEVCPDGVIACSKCDTPLITGSATSKKIDFTALNDMKFAEPVIKRGGE